MQRPTRSTNNIRPTGTRTTGVPSFGTRTGTRASPSRRTIKPSFGTRGSPVQPSVTRNTAGRVPSFGKRGESVQPSVTRDTTGRMPSFGKRGESVQPSVTRDTVGRMPSFGKRGGEPVQPSVTRGTDGRMPSFGSPVQPSVTRDTTGRVPKYGGGSSLHKLDNKDAGAAHITSELPEYEDPMNHMAYITLFSYLTDLKEKGMDTELNVVLAIKEALYYDKDAIVDLMSFAYATLSVDCLRSEFRDIPLWTVRRVYTNPHLKGVSINNLKAHVIAVHGPDSILKA